jgi:hypothetical protein
MRLVDPHYREEAFTHSIETKTRIQCITHLLYRRELKDAAANRGISNDLMREDLECK